MASCSKMQNDAITVGGSGSNIPNRRRHRNIAIVLLGLAGILFYSNFWSFNSAFFIEVYQHPSNHENQRADKINLDVNKDNPKAMENQRADKINLDVNKGKPKAAKKSKNNPPKKGKSKLLELTEQMQEPIDADFFFPDFKLAWDEMENHPTADFIGQDAFSGSWWQSKRNFLRYDSVEYKTPSAEGASFEVFQINEGNMRVTRDWMDLNIEHMSKWFNIVLHKSDNRKYVGRILQIFKDYVYSEDRLYLWNRLNDDSPKSVTTGDWLEVSQSTIAVIAFMPYTRGTNGGKEITKWSLAATIMSLVQLGVGRIVVSGVESDRKGERILKEAVTEIANATKDWKISEAKQMTSFAFCNCGNSTSDWAGLHDPNIPKAALRRLRHVLLKTMRDSNIRNCWGGPSSTAMTTKAGEDVMDRWKYVFLGEPDLILNTRPSAIAKLGKSLKHGGVLAPHRLQPTPHDSDFGFEQWTDVLPFLIPNISPKLDEVVEIDHYQTGAIVETKNTSSTSAAATAVSSCCDDGNQKPCKQFEDCGTWWWECGFSYLETQIQTKKKEERRKKKKVLIDKPSVLEAHKRMKVYPLARLKRGTGVVFVGAESGRRCLPSNGACTAAKKIG